MRYKAILFDLDGTLLPMDMMTFAKGYFHLLARRLVPLGVDPEKFTPAMWAGCKAMAANDGSRTNADAFWSVFSGMTGADRARFEPVTDDFYANDFNGAKAFTGENPLAVQAVRAARAASGTVALATNPLFPRVAQNSRLSWVGLGVGDFDLVTDYNTDAFCKPDPSYYISVCKRLGVEPRDCLMIGNDEGEDMAPACALGMDCFLVTDTMIACEAHPWNGRRGSFAELCEFLKEKGND